MSKVRNDENDELESGCNDFVSWESFQENTDKNAQSDSSVDADWRKEIDDNDNQVEVKENGDEIIEFVDESLHSQPEGNFNKDVRYSHPDIVLRKETTVYSYHDSDSELVDYDLDTGSLLPGAILDKSDADSWDWTFHDENVSDLDIKMVPLPRKMPNLLTNIVENFSTKTPEEALDLEDSKQPLDTEYNKNITHERNKLSEQKNNAEIYSKLSPRKKKSERSRLLRTQKSKNTVVTFLSRQNTCNGFSEEQDKESDNLNTYNDDIVYFEDLQSSQVFKTRLKYLGNNCSVGSKISCSKESQIPKTDKTSKRKRIEEFLPQATRPGNLFDARNVYRNFTKLEEMFTLSCRHVRSSVPIKVNSAGDKDSLSSPVSLSLSKSEFFLPPIVNSRDSSNTGQRHSTIGHLPEKLIGWKLNKGRTMSRSNMFVKSVPKEDDEKKLDDPQSSGNYQNWTGLGRFRHAAKMVLILLWAVGLKPKKQKKSIYNFLSWTVVYNNAPGISRLNYDRGALTFDPLMYKANKESTLTQEIKDILRQPSRQRTETHIHAVMVSLHNVIPSFSEFPKRIQQSMIKVCMYERFEMGRVIIRQGHRAENFYFIISGSAVVTKMDSGENHVHTTSILGKGNSFGELAFLQMSKRQATVTCREDVELLCIERDDFIEIFMCPHKGEEPDHITFLKSIDLFQGWPVQAIPSANPKICAFTYVRRDVILCQNSAVSDWIFVVYSGTCKVLALLDDRPIRRREELHRLPETTKLTLPSDFSLFSKLTIISPAVSMDEPSRSTAQHRETPTNMDEPSRSTAQHRERPTNMDEPSRSTAQHQETPTNMDEPSRSTAQHRETQTNISRKPEQDVTVPNPALNGKDKDSNNADDNNDLPQREHETHLNDIMRTHPVLPSIDQDGQEPRATSKDSSVSKVSFQASLPPSPTRSMLRHKRQPQSAALRQQVLPGSATQSQQLQPPVRKTAFIEIARLEAGDVFGLEHVVLSGMRDVASCSLVSEGAEVVLLSRSFFQKHLTEETMKRMRLVIQPLPSEKSLQKKYETKKRWDVYKSQTMARHTQGSRRFAHKRL